MRRGSKIYFYEILKDLKNNVNTLIKGLNNVVKKNDLENFKIKTKEIMKNEHFEYKSTWLKSKLPDLRKLKIINYQKGYNEMQVTFLGADLLNFFELNDKKNYELILKNLLGTYDYNGFRPYAFFVKSIFEVYKYESINDNLFKKILSLKLEDVIDQKNLKEKIENVQILKEAKRPKSYILNFLFFSGLIEINENTFSFKKNVVEFINMYFTDKFYDLDYVGNKSSKKRNNRPNQKDFRNEVLKRYNYKCAISGAELKYKDKFYFEAAHIYPHCAGGSSDIINGMPMLKHYHQLFDAGAFTVKYNIMTKNYDIILSQKIKHSKVFPNNLILNNLPKEKKYHPSILSLTLNNKKVFNVGVKNYCKEKNIELYDDGSTEKKIVIE